MTEIAARSPSQQVNTVEVSVVFGIYGIGEIECQSIRCKVLPWIHQNTDIHDTATSAVDRVAAVFWSVAESSIKSNWGAKNAEQKLGLRDHWQAFRKLIAGVLAAQMEQYQIDVSLLVDVMVEQHVGDIGLPGSTPAWLRWKGFDSVLEENGKNVAPKDVKVVSKRTLVFSPDTQVDHPFVELEVTNKVRLAEIVLEHDGRTLAKSQVADVLEDDGANEVRLPTVSMACYHVLAEAEDQKPMLDVHLRFLGGSEVVLGVPVEVPALTKAPRVLFVDLGSTTSKMLRVRLPPFKDSSKVPGNFDEWGRINLRRELRSLDVQTSVAMAFGPERTEVFTKAWELPDYNKPKLVAEGEEALALWFERASRKFATGMAKGGTPLGKIYWSFPAVTGVDIERLRGLIMSRSSAWMLGTAELITEHNSLRHRYQETLKVLGAAANEQRKKHERAKARNKDTLDKKKKAKRNYNKKRREYKNKNFVSRFFSSEPKKPDLSRYSEMLVPQLEEWHQQFLKLSISSKLDEFVIVDAGGFTLDVYVKRTGEKPRGSSVRAGGEELTRRVEDYLRQKASGKDENLRKRAELRKQETCEGTRLSTLGRKIKKWTTEIYSDAADKALQHGLKDTQKTSLNGIPLVLSGGAMKNPWLVELLEHKIEGLGIRTLKVNSESLTEQLPAFGLSKPVLTRFVLATSGYDPANSLLDIRFDIVGGLVELAAKSDS